MAGKDVQRCRNASSAARCQSTLKASGEVLHGVANEHGRILVWTWHLAPRSRTLGHVLGQWLCCLSELSASSLRCPRRRLCRHSESFPESSSNRECNARPLSAVLCPQPDAVLSAAPALLALRQLLQACSNWKQNTPFPVSRAQPQGIQRPLSARSPASILRHCSKAQMPAIGPVDPPMPL